MHSCQRSRARETSQVNLTSGRILFLSLLVLILMKHLITWNTGSLRFEKPLTPCCVGTSNQYSCGDVDENGVKKYKICKKPESAFFWDLIHPTQQGWFAVYSALRGTLNQLYYWLLTTHNRLHYCIIYTKNLKILFESFIRTSISMFVLLSRFWDTRHGREH